MSQIETLAIADWAPQPSDEETRRHAAALEAGLAAAPTAQGYLDLARLCQDTQQPEEAARYYRQGLELVTGS